jgi:hypothetical protein
MKLINKIWTLQGIYFRTVILEQSSAEFCMSATSPTDWQFIVVYPYRYSHCYSSVGIVRNPCRAIIALCTLLYNWPLLKTEILFKVDSHIEYYHNDNAVIASICNGISVANRFSFRWYRDKDRNLLSPLWGQIMCKMNFNTEGVTTISRAVYVHYITLSDTIAWGKLRVPSDEMKFVWQVLKCFKISYGRN